jgi:superfamily I DNA/RNA helicase
MLRKSPPASPVKALEAALASLRRSRRAPPGSEAALERLFNLAALYDDLPSFLDILAVSAPGDVPEPHVEGVRVMTIHAAKGLEFEHVFVAALEEGLLPFTLFEKKPGMAGEEGTRELEEERIAEERRLLYVAMTRAKSGLYLSCARSRNYRGRPLRFGPSRFLACLEEVPLIREPMPRQRDPQLRLF